MSTILVAALGLSVAAQQTRPEALRPQEGRQRTDAVLEGMTAAQRVHATLHQSPMPDRPPLLDAVVSRKISDNHYAAGEDPPLAVFVREISCSADLVILGTPTSRASFPLEDGTFFFSDYSFSVEAVWKDDASSGISPGASTIVTRIGGEIVVEGVPIEAKRESTPMLQIGQRYVLFGDYVPATGAFWSNETLGTFEVSASRITTLARQRVRGTDLSRQGLPLQGFQAVVARTNCSGGGR